MNNADKLAIRDVPGGAVLAVKVVPGSSRDRVSGVLGDSLKIATSAPPEKGKANAAIAVLLARTLGVDRRQVELLSAPANPRKQFRLAGLSAAEVRQRLQNLD
jgi:uncharacterized protein (TIGR00251 family)